MLGAMSYMNKDIPPFLLVRGNPARVFGVNVRGLQRNGFTASVIENIKDIYRILFKSSRCMTERIEQLRSDEDHDIFTRDILGFMNASKRGIILKTQ